MDLAHQLVAALIASGIPAAEIAVVTPFRKQARAIRTRLKSTTSIDPGLQQEVVVDTVERMQGQEREVILISCAATDRSFIRAIADFLFLPARLNVSVTRARSKVILMADDSLLSWDPVEPEHQEALLVWNNLHASSHVIEV